MKKFALIGANRVANVVIAESEATIGPLASAFVVVDITDMENPPSVGFERLTDGTFLPDMPKEARATWGQEAPVVEEVPAPRAPSNRRAQNETPAEE